MKGVVFNLLEEMIEQKFGLKVWESLLVITGQDGVFVSTRTYTDEQLLSLMAATQEVSGTPVNELLREFGKFMLPRFYQHNPEFFKASITLKDFLLSVDQVIPVAVRKQHPDAGLP